MDINIITVEEIKNIDFSIISNDEIQKLAERIIQEQNDYKRHELLYAAIDLTYRLTYGENAEHWKVFDKNVGKLICNSMFKEDLNFMLKDISKLLAEKENKTKNVVW